MVFSRNSNRFFPESPSARAALDQASRLRARIASACSPAKLVNSLVPRDGFDLTADQRYGAKPRQRLDIYQPQGGVGARLPVVIFFYGGNWRCGDKADYLFVGEALTARGFITVIPDYRLFPEVRFPDFLVDAAAATAWVLTHLEMLGGDPARVHVMGHSAGAYIAAMLALDGRWLGSDRARLARAVGLAGPYDFPPTDPEINAVFGTKARWAETQPIAHVDGSAPPMLLAGGSADCLVLPEHARRLAERIRERGGHAEERYYVGLDHLGVIGALAAPLRFLAPVLDDVVEFLQPAPSTGT